MLYSSNRQIFIKRYARFVLALFVLSVMNMSIQIPAHSAMLQSMTANQMSSQQMLKEMSPMSAMPVTMESMQNCDCPPVLCETIASQNNQNLESLYSLGFNYMQGFLPAYSSSIADAHHQASVIQFDRHDRQYRQFSPPPLSISTVLHL